MRDTLALFTTVACVVLLLAVVSATDVSGTRYKSVAGGTNITAGFECNSDCTVCNSTGEMVPGGCTWVPPALSYIIYSCNENRTQIQLLVFGPLHVMCSPNDPVHVTLHYPVNQCVHPPAGGYTIYHCPTDNETSVESKSHP